MSDWLGLQDRIAVVTGAAGGVGQAVARALANAGTHVALLDREAAPCEALAAELAGPVRAIGLGCDVADGVSVTEAAARIQAALGAANILVNNAGVLRAGRLEELPVAEWDAMLGINLTGYLRCAQAFGAAMLTAGRGSLVHVASIAASHAQGGSGAYSVGKAGVGMLSRQLATEWGPRGVRSNVVSPGLIRTPMSEAFYAAPGVAERRTEVVPLRRIGTSEDIADAVLFLASDRASYISGEEITVDGGFTRGIMNMIPRPAHD